MKTFISIIDLLTCITLIAAVIIQSGKTAGLSGVLGGSDTFLSKNKSKSLDAKLSRATKWIAAVFVLLTLLLHLL